MARDKNNDDYIGPIRKLLVGILVLVLLGVFLVWRIDSPRVERLRAAAIDAVVPSFDWAMAPITGTANLISDFQSYSALAAQNQDLRRELQQMKAWKEAALQLEQENAKLRDLNNVRLDPRLTYITGETDHATFHDVAEIGINVIFGGHYATETAGLKALAEHLATRFELETVFLDLPTGA